MAEQTGTRSSPGGLLGELPIDHLKQGFQDLLSALAERAAGSVTNKAEEMTERLTHSVQNGGAGLISAGSHRYHQWRDGVG
jgi:hypothetical protein